MIPIRSGGRPPLINTQPVEEEEVPPTQEANYDVAGSQSPPRRTDSNTYSPPIPELRRTGSAATSEN